MRTLTILALTALSAALVGCGRRPVKSRVAADARSGDLGKLQGTWAIEAFDDGEIGNLTEEKKNRLLEEVQQDRLTFDGERLIIHSGGRDIQFAVALDEANNPKVMFVSVARDFGPGGGTFRGTAAGTFRGTSPGTFRGTQRTDGPNPNRREWIYKFDGDVLVIAIGGDKRPTEFKAKKSSFEPGKPFEQGVVVIRLKKTDQPPRPTPPRTTNFGTRR